MRLLKNFLFLGMLALPVALPAQAADEEQSGGFFSRTWNSVKGFFGAVKEDSKDAAQAVGGAAAEGGRRAANAGRAAGKAVTEGAKDVRDAVVTPSGGGGDSGSDD